MSLSFTPEVKFKNATFNFDTGSALGNFNFKNDNPILSIEWQNPKINVYWLPDYDIVQPLITTRCSGGVDNDPCDRYWDGQCAVLIGTFIDYDLTFKTKAGHSKEEELSLSQTLQQKSCVLDMIATGAFYGYSQLIESKGHVKAKSKYHDFGKVKVDGEYFLVY